MELRRSRAWNPSKTVWHQGRRENTAQGADAMPDRVAIPYTLKRDAMPTPSGLDKKRHRCCDGVFWWTRGESFLCFANQEIKFFALWFAKHFGHRSKTIHWIVLSLRSIPLF